MTMPKGRIRIFKDGRLEITGKEKTDNCYELSNLGKAMGKVVKDDDVDHTPVHQSVHNSGKG